MHKYNILMLVLVGMTIFNDGVEQFTVYLLVPVLKTEFNTSVIMNSILLASSLLGAAIGTISAGFIFNNYGEKIPFLGCNIIIALFGALSVAWVNFFWFVFCRVLVGFAIGININYSNNLFENLPQKYRAWISVFILIFTDFGIIFYTFLFYVFTLNSPEIEVWKTIVLISTIPMFLNLIFNFIFFEESPRKLLWNKEYEKLFSNLNKYSGKEEYLSKEEKEELINTVYEKNSNDKQNNLEENDSYCSRLSNAFKLHFWAFFLLIFIWAFLFLYAFSIGYYLPLVLEHNEFMDLMNYDEKFNKKEKVDDDDNSEIKYDNKTESGKKNSFLELKSFLKKVGKEEKEIENISDMVNINNNNDSKCYENLDNSNNINKSNKSKKEDFMNKIFIKKFRKMKQSNNQSNDSDEKLNNDSDLVKEDGSTGDDINNNKLTLNKLKDLIENYNDKKDNIISAKMVNENSSDYEPYSEKYLKIIIAESISIVGMIISCFIATTNFSRKYFLIICILISLVCSFGKVLAIVYIEYFTAVLRASTKSGCSFVKLFTCENFHTDYRETIFVFCGAIARIAYVFGPFFVDGLLITGLYSPNYYEISIAITVFIILLFIDTDNPEKDVDDFKKNTSHLKNEIEKNV